MAEASPADVRLEIDTGLDDPTITSVIERISRDIDRSDTSVSGEDRGDLEAVLAAYHIATTLDRAEESAKTGRSSVTYEQSLIEELRARAMRIGADDELFSEPRRTASITVPRTRKE